MIDQPLLLQFVSIQNDPSCLCIANLINYIMAHFTYKSMNCEV